VDAPDPADIPDRPSWDAVFADVIDRAHLVTGRQLPAVADELVRPLGLTVQVFMVDLPQRVLAPVGDAPEPPIRVEGTLAGRAYQHGELTEGTDAAGERLLWVPVLDGCDRVGVLRVGLLPAARHGGFPVHRLWTLAGLLGHLVVAKLVYSDELRALRSGGRLSVASELVWDLLPPRTFATEQMVVSALLEPFDRVAGDAYDYSVSSDRVDLAIFDGVGHDVAAGLTTTLALTAVRNARRSADRGLVELAAAADRLLTGQPGPLRFVTAVLARLHTATGLLEYVLAGHPPPLVFRGSRMIKELAQPPRPPLGVVGSPAPVPEVAHEQLEPGDRVLFYSDGVTEARNARGEFFGEQRLIDLAERAELDRLSAPETLRRLAAAVLAHQDGLLQDDATLLIVDWSSGREQRIFPDLDR
jgi:hypothetical protein